ncbi:MAG: radical SAM family heme chaperone HemW [Solobacterium sp.]|nr:radical SAM family heme chaperone HemW [Solobacterium sp.]
MMTAENKPEHLYIHVPFCRTICFYCDFCHVVYTEALADRWLDALTIEEDRLRDVQNLKTIYIGGGTPNSLSAFQLRRLLDIFAHIQCEEYTVEINPESLNQEKVEILRDHGVNRISMGMQSSDPEELKMMNRHHTMEDLRNAVNLLRQAGIENISLDLMYSLPGQTMDTLKKSLEDAISLKPTHISIYSLTIEENSVFGRRGYTTADEDTEADMYEWICKVLPAYGYEQYEISNFAQKGKESRHNLAYWHYKDFYGFSAGASGKEGHIRYDKPRDLKAYIADPFTREEIPLTREEERFEHWMMSLRMIQGLDLEEFRERYGISFTECYPEITQSLIQRGLLGCDGKYLRCTKQGYPIMNEILEEYL